MKELSIIIPYHNEDEETIKPLFMCLNAQRDVDWSRVEIIISNNCNHPKHMDSFFNNFSAINNHIRYVECPVKLGPGQNRQYATDICEGKYVTYLDIDDELTHEYAVYSILKNISTEKDAYYSNEIIEEMIDGKIVRTLYTGGSRMLHGKIFKKDFLFNRNIKFSDTLFMWEDNYFCTIVSMCNPNVSKNIEPFYLFKYRTDSTSRGKEKSDEEKKLINQSWLYLPIKILEFLQADNHMFINQSLKFYMGFIEDRFKKYGKLSRDIGEEPVALQLGYIINCIDPTLKITTSLPPNGVSSEEFRKWLKDKTSRCTKKQFELKYDLKPSALRAYIME
jgi:hypothetical protein